MVSPRFHFVLLSSLLVSTSAFAFDEDTPKISILSVKPDDAARNNVEPESSIPPHINIEENPLEVIAAPAAIAPPSSTPEVVQQGWFDWGAGHLNWLKENTVGAALEGQRALKAINSGVDLYPFFKGVTVKTYDYMNEPAEEIVVPPIAAIVIDGFSKELMPIIENLMINTVRLGGQKAAAEMADKLGIAQFMIDQGVNTVNPLKQFMGPIKLISSFLNGVNLAAILGDQATQGVLGTLKKRADFEVAKKLKIEAGYIKAREEVKVQEAIWDTERKEKSGLSSFFHIRPEYQQAKIEWEQQQNKYSTRKQIFFDLLTKIVSKTLDKTVHSMVDDMEHLVGPSLMPVMKTLILGTEIHTKDISKKVKDTVDTLSPAKQAFNTVVKYTTSPKALANLLVPTVVQTAWNKELANVNRTLGAAAGNVGGEVITEQLLRTLKLSKTRLFSREQLQLSVSKNLQDSPLPETLQTGIYYLDGFIDLDEVLQKILHTAGRQASKKVLNVIKPMLSQTFSNIGIQDDINGLMYGQIQPSRSAQVVASTVSAVVGGVAHLYTVFSTPSLDVPEDYSESEEDEWGTYLADMGFSSASPTSPETPILKEPPVFSPRLTISDTEEQTEEAADAQSALTLSSAEMPQEEEKLILNQLLENDPPLPSEPHSVIPKTTSEFSSPDLDASIGKSNISEIESLVSVDTDELGRAEVDTRITREESRASLEKFLSKQNYPEAFKSLRATLSATVPNAEIVDFLMKSNQYPGWTELPSDDKVWVITKITEEPKRMGLEKFLSQQDYPGAFKSLRATLPATVPDAEIVGFLLTSNKYQGWTELSSEDKEWIISKIAS